SKPEYPSIMKPSHCACAPMGRLPACRAILNHGKINLTNPSVMAIRSEDFFEYRIWFFFVFTGTSIGALTGAFSGASFSGALY
ncbi:MAG: hypothetical protein ACPHVI_04665, partial [Candidatus Puniceispirillaceae bacterium]